ncbi:hypothetical protein Sjap_002070 [Stephania japonica]|uniref:Disease resistance R13L4/SHOC-2-like LRR domain-containing protein n=1 Tax=Stephania japonica TaxID=461633 RepID=A0AAP0KNR6_9MAGN
MQGVVATELPSLRRSTKEKVLSALSSPWTCFKSVGFHHEIAHKIIDIRKRMDFIEEEKKKFQLIQSRGSKDDDGVELLVVEKKERDMTTSVIDETAIFGRDFDRDVIKSKLLMIGENSIQKGMKSEIFVVEMSLVDQLDHNRVRHLTVPYTDGKNTALLTISDAKKLRTLKMNSEFTREMFDVDKIFHHLRFLRVLDLEALNLKELTVEVGNLKHLRYFKLVGRNLVKIPETLCNLGNLLSFLLIGSYDLRELPRGMGKMTSLRHLEFAGCWHVNSLFSPFEQSSSLHKFDEFDDFIVNNINAGSEHKLWWSNRLKNGLKNQANLKCTGGNVRIAFPNLKELRIVGILSLEEWRLVADTVDLMPQLRKLYLKRCNKALVFPPFGKLKFLQVLEIDGNMLMERIGPEILGIPYGTVDKEPTSVTSFPRLEYLRLENMEKVEHWTFPVDQDPNSIMPHLRELIVAHFHMLRVLPALGILKSLEKLELNSLDLVQQLGKEFMGLSEDNNLTSRVGSVKPSTTMKTLFPSLTSLTLCRLIWLGEWEFPSEEQDVEIMPCLNDLLISDCLTLRELPPLGRLKSLESLVLSKLYTIKHVGLQFWGVHTGHRNKSDEGESVSAVAFPMLRRLEFCDFPMWEEWNMLPRLRRPNRKRKGCNVVEREDISITMPCLEHLLIVSCPRLKEIPLNISSGTRWKLEIRKCYELRIANTEGMVNLQELEVDGESIDLTD